MAYSKTGPFTNDTDPAIDANFLNAMEASAAGVRGQWEVTVAASGEPTDVKDSADYVCDGTADQVQINAALSAIASTTIDRGGNGGKVTLIGRNFDINGPILMQTQAWLTSAYGMHGTMLNMDAGYTPGTDGGMIELANTSTQYTRVGGFTLVGFDRNVGGVHYEVGTAQEYDAFHTVEDLYVWNCNGDGLSFRQAAESVPRNRGNMIRNIRIIDAGRHGVNVACPDSFYHMVDTGSAFEHGFNIAHSNNRFTNCKAWFSDANGFHLSGGRDNQLTSCESQDNEDHGYYVSGSSQNIVGCIADSNGYSGTGDGFYVLGNGAQITGTATEKAEHVASQRWGVNIVGTPKVQIRVNTHGNTSGSITGSGHAESIIDVVDW